MNEISIGAIGAAVIAGIVSVLGLIIAKEQKVSEFRQSWIEDLRKCVVSYLVNVNAIADALSLARANKPFSEEKLLSDYKSLNEANHGIKLRINSSEKPAQELLSVMEKFEIIAEKNSSLTSENIRNLEKEFVKSAQNLLKFEWNRVKAGEPNFIWTKRLLYFIIFLFILVFLYGIFSGKPKVPTTGEICREYCYRLL